MKIYAACLASYNAGILHGAWIDATDDADEMSESIRAMLRKSPCPNVTVECPDCEGDGRPYGFNSDSDKENICETCKGKGEVPSAEEYAIHDYEGIPSTFGEYPSLESIADFVALCDEYDYIDSDDIAAIVADIGAEYVADKLRDDFCGIFDSFRDYSDDAADEMLSAHDIKDDSPLARYFDYEAFARDLRHDMNTVELPSGNVAVFYA